MNNVLGAMGDDDNILVDDDDEGWPSIGDLSSSEATGLGGNDACIICSSFSMQSSTTCFSVKVILRRDSITLSMGPESVLTDAGDD